ncbi:GTP pyrophosphokinase [Methylobacterium sp. SyP6R]|uniref:GTP pyrophosphokinase n=1 Tax=Methylobacterium sp. SyP6R TaxID=2718876 RepID=UPI001F28D8EA|nr:RelA/SpoT domain-containing protein [Methylobacterium sp. SyP6R]MCF4124243.1 RelA/SpoT domain-containing protein [Methylobacterium sp. SyP6R]
MAGDSNGADPISAFVVRYQREYDYFYEVARLVSQRCDALAAENGIRAIVTFRAKSPDRLEAKLRQRNSEKNYTSEDEIRNDIVDLSGVRVALYFPGDRNKIGNLINSAFQVDKVKSFPDKPKTDQQKFDGYHAEHYRVRLVSEILPESQRRYGGSMVEIQVASVLMHAWSEVEHDLNYKQLSGNLSDDEISILDGINGIVLAGEVFLERLQVAFEARVSRSGSSFSSQYELAAFLYDRLRATTTGSNTDLAMGRIDLLFRLLQKAELNNPDALMPYIENIKLQENRGPLADRFIDHLLSRNPGLSDVYLNLRRSSGSGARSFFSGQDQPSPEIVGSYLQKWIVLERFIRALSKIRNIGGRHYSFPSRDVVNMLQLDVGVQAALDVLRRIRNELVHGVNIPGEDLLQTADRDLGIMLESFAASDDPEISTAMEWARSGEPDNNQSSI